MSRYPEKLSRIEITTTMGCRLNCRFCPQGKLLNEYRKTENPDKTFMTLEDFKGILLEIYENGTITFSGMSETFQNREASLMMREAYKQGFKVQLFTTLQGMQDEDFENIKDINFQMIVLHIPDEEGNSKFIIDEKYIKHLQRFISKYDILYYSCHGKVHPMVKNIINPKTPIASEMKNRAGNLTEENLEEYHWESGRIVCTGTIFNTKGTASGWTPLLLPNGTLLACCNDYGLELILGNLYNESWEEILNSQKFAWFERSFDDDSVRILCRKCNRANCRSEAVKRNSNILWNNAIKVGRLLQSIEMKQVGGNILNDEKMSKINDLLFSKNICIFGLGKLFFDTYNTIPWKNVLLSDRVGICSDNNKKWKGRDTYLFDLQFVEPENLKSYEDLVVVTYVTNDHEIKKQLRNMGIHKILNIYEIFNIFD